MSKGEVGCYWREIEEKGEVEGQGDREEKKEALTKKKLDAPQYGEKVSDQSQDEETGGKFSTFFVLHATCRRNLGGGLDKLKVKTGKGSSWGMGSSDSFIGRPKEGMVSYGESSMRGKNFFEEGVGAMTKKRDQGSRLVSDRLRWKKKRSFEGVSLLRGGETL